MLQEQKPFEVFVTDFQGKTHTLKVKAPDTIYSLMNEMQAKTGESIEGLRLIFGPHNMKANVTAGDYNLKHGATVHMVQLLKFVFCFCFCFIKLWFEECFRKQTLAGRKASRRSP